MLHALQDYVAKSKPSQHLVLSSNHLHKMDLRQRHPAKEYDMYSVVAPSSVDGTSAQTQEVCHSLLASMVQLPDNIMF